ncbi:unnamed protein product [Sphagnum troendelagicum]|uniref:Uncharacterized protein n=1 Tax=Sphagnum troendelagicum TaxID=128251 RepID=A0ABP0TZB5_9BRYO
MGCKTACAKRHTQKKGGGCSSGGQGRKAPPPPPPQVHPPTARRSPPRTESSDLDSNHRKPPGNELRDLEMRELPKSPSHQKEGGALNSDLRKVSASAPNPKLQFGFQDLEDSHGSDKDARANPFASPNRSRLESEWRYRAQGEATDGWTFQGRRKHAPKLASPRLEAPHPSTSTPHRESTPGSKRGFAHSEIHPSFTALDIQIPGNKEPLRTRIWPVLTRVKNRQKETLVHSKNKTPSSLPLSIRLSGPMESKEVSWDPNSAWPELMQRIELELVE